MSVDVAGSDGTNGGTEFPTLRRLVRYSFSGTR